MDFLESLPANALYAESVCIVSMTEPKKSLSRVPLLVGEGIDLFDNMQSTSAYLGYMN